MSDVHARFRELLERMAAINSAKSHDYGGESDPLRNLRQCADAGIDPWVGVLVRITDKVARLQAFAKSRSFSVKDESIEDTVIDLANYALLCLILYEEQRDADTPFTPMSADELELVRSRKRLPERR